MIPSIYKGTNIVCCRLLRCKKVVPSVLTLRLVFSAIISTNLNPFDTVLNNVDCNLFRDTMTSQRFLMVQNSRCIW